MERLGNVNVRVASKGSNINVKAGFDDKQRRLQSLNHAKHLQQKFGQVADGSLGFLRKCFNRMSEDKVWQLYESAMRPNLKITTNRFAWFIGAAKAQPEMSD